MGRIVGGVGLSHVPSVGPVVDRNRTQEPAWKPLFDAYVPVREWLAQLKPDVAIVIYNDHAADFGFDKYPTFALGVAESYAIGDEGFGTRPLPQVQGDLDLSIHLSEALVCEHELRVVDERSRDRDALLLTARQLFRERVHAMLQTDPLQHLKRLALLRRQRQAEDTHHEGDVLKHREPGDQPKILEDKADAAAERLDLRRAERAQVAAQHFQIAFTRELLTEEQTEERRLAGAAGAGQKDELAFVDGEGEVAEGVNAALVELRQM